MNTITAKLIKDGNSTAIRLPVTLLRMSGLHGTVGLTAQKGRIVVSQVKQPRAGWKLKIDRLAATGMQTAKDNELDAWDATLSDSLDD